MSFDIDAILEADDLESFKKVDDNLSYLFLAAEYGAINIIKYYYDMEQIDNIDEIFRTTTNQQIIDFLLKTNNSYIIVDGQRFCKNDFIFYDLEAKTKTIVTDATSADDVDKLNEIISSIQFQDLKLSPYFNPMTNTYAVRKDIRFAYTCVGDSFSLNGELNIPNYKHSELFTYMEYPVGGHFIEHCDTKENPLHTHTIILMPPHTDLVGGELIINHDTKTIIKPHHLVWTIAIFPITYKHSSSIVEQGVKKILKSTCASGRSIPHVTEYAQSMAHVMSSAVADGLGRHNMTRKIVISDDDSDVEDGGMGFGLFD